MTNGFIQPDWARSSLMALVDRSARQPAVCLVKNFGLKRGAIASSVSHDSHNIIAVGTNVDDLAASINLLVYCQAESHSPTAIQPSIAIADRGLNEWRRRSYRRGGLFALDEAAKALAQHSAHRT